MSGNDQYAISFDSQGVVTGFSEVGPNGTLYPETLDFGESLEVAGAYVVHIETEGHHTEYDILAQDATTGYWYKFSEGYGTPDLTAIAGLVMPTTFSNFDGEDQYRFDLDAGGTTVTAMYEVRWDGSFEREDLEPDTTYTVSGDYIVEVETDDGEIEWSVYQVNPASGFYVEVAEGEGAINIAGLDDIVANALAASGSGSGGQGRSTDMYQIVLNDAGTEVIAIFEVKSDGRLENEGISPNETYTVVGNYVVESEAEHGTTEWSIYLLDAATGYYAKAAEGYGPLDLNDLDAVVAGFVPGSYERADSDDHYSGGTGDDDFHGEDGDDGDDHYEGGEGHDWVTYAGASGTRVNLGHSGAQDTGHGYDSFSGIEGVRTGDGDDDLDGDDFDNAFDSADGDDTLNGGGGNDSLDAGRGNDEVHGDGGDDDVHGDGGYDTIYGGTGDDTLRGGREQDDLHGGDGHDSLAGQRHMDTLAGGTGDDTLKGGGGADWMCGDEDDDFVKGGTYADTVLGGTGNDTLIGNRHDDELDGGDGMDHLNGGGHDDTLTGGTGDDELHGGSGADVFVFDLGHDADTIDDFDVAEDTLQLTLALANGRTAADIAASGAVMADGVVLDLGGGDTILLEGLVTLDGLAAAIEIV